MTVKLLKQQHSCTKPLKRQQPRSGVLAAIVGAAQSPVFGPRAGLLQQRDAALDGGFKRDLTESI
jgi:hypothetical protein